jgi:hypothetical protein
MPQLWLTQIILQLTASAISLTAAKVIAAVIQYVAITAATMGANKLLSPKPPSFSDASLADRKQMVRSPIAARQVIYGQSQVSGNLVYISTTGTKNEYLHLVIALAGHEVEEIGDIYFDNELALTGAGPAAQGRFTGYADIYKMLGSSTQAAEPNLITATASLTNGKWTANHRLRGIAYVYIRLTWNEQIFVSGIPNVSAVVKGKKVYDPRTATTAYSTNSALCLRDYLLDSTYGMGMSSTEVDDAAFIVAANISDEQVEVKPITSPATYESRYQTNGVLYTSATPDENIGKLLTAMGGLVAYSGGMIIPYAAGYRIPTVTLTEKDFVSGITVQTKTSARDRVNGVKGVFVSAKSEWQPTDFPPVTSATYLSQDNNVRYWRDVTLPMTTSSSCAQRLARIELRRARQEITLTSRFRLDAMKVRAGDTIMVTLSRFGWTNKVFEVMEWNFVSDGAPPQLLIEMTLRETASSVYDWTASDETEFDQQPTTTLPNPFSVAAPTSITLVADGTTQLIQADGTAMPRIKVAWSAPSDEFIQSGGQVLIEYKQGNATTYLTWSKVNGDQTLDYISSDVKIGTTYDVRLSGLSYFGISTSYLTGSITVAKDTTAPATPSSLTAAVGTGKAVSLDWDDNTEADLSEYGIYRNTSGTTPSSATVDKIAEVRASRFVDTEVNIGTTYYYWVNAYDTVENVSGFATRVTAVPTYVGGGSVDPTVPSTPSAPTYVSEANYLSTDGTSLARITVAVPSLPTNAVGMNVLYKTSAGTSYIIGAQVTASGNLSIDDLSPGVSYVFAVQAFSFSGVFSAVSSTLSRTAPATPTAPANYTGGIQVDGRAAPPAFTTSGTRRYGVGLFWAEQYTGGYTYPSDFAYWEIKGTATNTDAATDYNVDNGSTTAGLYRTRDAYFYFYTSTVNTATYFRLRAVNRSGQASSWYTIGSVYQTPLDPNYPNWYPPGGSMMIQDAASVAITGGSTKGQTAIGSTNFFANDASSGISGGSTAVDVKDVNFRVYSGTTQKLRVDYTNGEVYIQTTRVLSTRKTGWSTATGTATRTSFDTTTVTTEELAQRVKALIDDLYSTAGHGLIGS